MNKTDDERVVKWLASIYKNGYSNAIARRKIRRKARAVWSFSQTASLSPSTETICSKDVEEAYRTALLWTRPR